MKSRKNASFIFSLEALGAIVLLFGVIGLFAWIRTWYDGYRQYDPLIAVLLPLCLAGFTGWRAARSSVAMRAAEKEAWLRIAAHFPHKTEDSDQVMVVAPINLMDSEGPEIGSPPRGRGGPVPSIRVYVGQTCLHVSPFHSEGLPFGKNFDECRFWENAPWISIPFSDLRLDSKPASQTLDPRRPWFVAIARPGHLELITFDGGLSIRLQSEELAQLIEPRLNNMEARQA